MPSAVNESPNTLFALGLPTYDLKNLLKTKSPDGEFARNADCGNPPLKNTFLNCATPLLLFASSSRYIWYWFLL